MKVHTFMSFVFVSLLTASWALAETAVVPAGFDTDESARFDSVTVPVGDVQDVKSFQEASPLKKKHLKSRTDYLDRVSAIGLSRNEIKNLNTDVGQLLQVEANGATVIVSVYKTTGADAPPSGFINLSVAAAKKLGVKEGDKITVSHMETDVSLPIVTKKALSINTSLRESDL